MYRLYPVPEGVFSFEATIFRLDIAGTFQSRLTGVYGDMFKSQIADSKQRTLATEFFV